MIKVLWKTHCDKKLDLDSIAVYKNNIYVSAKNTSEILIYDKNNGNLKDKIEGNNILKLKRPNGLCVINHFLFIVDRDYNNCQIYNLKINEPIAVFGFKKLDFPYGVTGIFENNKYIIYITDNGNKNVYKYTLILKNDEILKLNNEIFINLPNSNLESILIDNEYKRILICDEDNYIVKVFDYSANLIKEIKEKFDGEPEGITIHGDKYIFTNQSKKNNSYHIYNRKDLSYIDTYKSSFITNADGIASDGDQLYAISDDCALVKFDIKQNNSNLLLLFGVGALILANLFN